MEYIKYDLMEDIKIGDLISNRYEVDENNKYIKTDKVVRSVYHRYLKFPVIGICTSVNGEKILVQTEGIVDLNVTGMITIDDLLMPSKEPGKAQAIPYPIYDEIIFRRNSFGKVIGIYRNYDKAQVLLSIN